MMSKFEFDVDPAMSRWNRWFGVNPGRCAVNPGRCAVSIDDDVLIACFGPWTLRTPVANIIAATITGPYRVWRVAGPARLSLKDRGLTFATNHRQGLCLQFRTPVAGIDPFGLIRHPSLTVTVADPVRLAHAVGFSEVTVDDAVNEIHKPETWATGRPAITTSVHEPCPRWVHPAL